MQFVINVDNLFPFLSRRRKWQMRDVNLIATICIAIFFRYFQGRVFKCLILKDHLLFHNKDKNKSVHDIYFN